MLELSSISDFVQQVAEATAAVMEIDITVFDRDLRRIAGTGRYREEIGRQITPTAAFARALESGRPVYILNPVANENCRLCDHKDACSEVANIAHPIVVGGRTEGILALIAFNEEQRLKLIRQKENYSRFLTKMTELISSKLLEQQAQVELAEASQRLASIVAAFNDGIIFVDASGRVISLNPAATRIMGLSADELLGTDFKSIWAAHPLLQTLKTGQSFLDKEVAWNYKGRPRRYLCSTQAVAHQGKIIGAIAFLKDYEAVRRMLNDVGGHKNFFSFEDILGTHPLLLEAKEKAGRAALTDSTVLILGESGTGKELFARGIHGHSHRNNGPFVALSCAAIPEPLLESELFGYEGGAFTGAKSKGKPGKFELASGGTIFLDEIGDLPLGLQAKLLRVLEEGQITRLGGLHPIPIDVRVIAATNRNLEEMVAQKEFRQDLFYRLNVIPLRLPTLRERKSDIPVLANYFLNKYRQLYAKNITGFSQQVIDLFRQYTWPGNVRELENAVEYAVNMAETPLIQPEHIPEKVRACHHQARVKVAESEGLLPLEEIEKMLLKRGLEILGSSDKAKIEIGRRLGLSRASVYRKLKKYGLKP